MSNASGCTICQPDELAAMVVGIVQDWPERSRLMAVSELQSALADPEHAQSHVETALLWLGEAS